MGDQSPPTQAARLLGERKVIVNLGVEVFEESLRLQGVEVVAVRWQPPAPMPQDVAQLLDELL
jgi:hypothetical protein